METACRKHCESVRPSVRPPACCLMEWRKWRQRSPGRRVSRKLGTHVRTLCRPVMKDTFRLQGSTKPHPLESRVTWSPLYVQKRSGRCSKGVWPTCRSADGRTNVTAAITDPRSECQRGNTALQIQVKVKL